MPFRDYPTDEAEMERFFRFAAIHLYKYAWHLLKDPVQAEDVVQSTYAAMIQYFDKIRGFDNKRFLAYAKKEIGHQCGLLHKKQERIVLEEDLPSGGDVPQAAVVDFVERELTREELRSCIRELPPRYREVLRLKYFENCTSEQIGRAMGLPANQVRVLLTRARTRLKQIYQRRIRGKEADGAPHK